MIQPDDNLVVKLGQTQSWLERHQDQLIGYVMNLVAAALIMVIGFWLAKLVARTLQHVMRARGVDGTVANFTGLLLRYAIIIFTLLAALGHVGVQTASIIAALGGAVLAVGMALQGSLSNLAAGVLLVVFRPFRQGDYVDLGGTGGTVLGIQFFSTTLRTSDNKIVVVPNNKVLSANITNYSQASHRRVDFTLSVGCDADIDTVKQLCTAVIEADRRIDKTRGITVRLNAITPSSLDFVVRVWTKTALVSEVYFDLLENIKRALDAHQVSLPCSQMAVYVQPQPSPTAIRRSDK